MTEPEDESIARSDADEVAAPAASAPDGASPAEDATPTEHDQPLADTTPSALTEAPSASAATPGWIPPDPAGGGRPRGCCLIAAVLAAAGMVLVVGALVALIFLGSQVRSILGGTVQFGTGGSGCSVTGSATTFPASATIHLVAYLERDVQAGESVSVTVTLPDGTANTSEESYETSGVCIYEDLPPGLAPGHYALEYRTGSEVLARGAFDITP